MQEKIIAAARLWIGTPFHHQARVKGAGCDCLGLFIGIAKELNIPSQVSDARGGFIPLAAFDNTQYSTTPDTSKLIAKLDMYLNHVEKSDMKVGDIVLIKLSGSPQHMGIITDYIGGGFGLLHSIHGQGVIEHRLDVNWDKSIYKVYRVK